MTDCQRGNAEVVDLGDQLRDDIIARDPDPAPM